MRRAVEPLVEAGCSGARPLMPSLLSRPVLALDLLRRLFLFGPGEEVISLAFAAAEAEGGAPELGNAIADMCTAAEAGLDHEGWLMELEAEFTRLVIGPQATPAVPYASFYLSPTRQLNTEETIAVRRHYLEASVSRQAGLGLPDDHLGIELDFLYHLLREEGRALAAGSSEQVAQWERRRDVFLMDHFARWVPQFAQALREATAHPFLLGAADALFALAGRPSA